MITVSVLTAFKIYMKGLSIFLQKRYFGVALPFIINSLMLSTWLLYTPYILEKLQITESQLGYAFFSMAVGAVTSLSFSSKLIKKYGEGRYTFFSTIGYITLIIGAVLSIELYQLCIILFITGAFAGSMDVGMNGLAALIEKKDRQRFMSACHGFWSLGFFIGASLGSLMMYYITFPFVHMFLLACIALILHLVFFGSLRLEKSEAAIEVKSGTHSLQNKTLLGFAVIGLLVMMTEGAVMDWCTLYMSEEIKAPDLWIGYGLAMFSLFMAVGRFIMDPLSDTYGSKVVIQASLVIVVLGIILVLAGGLLTALFGFSLMGFGVAGIVPEIYRLSSRIEGVNPSDGVATVAGTGYLGFLIGPIIMGYVAESYGYPKIFMLIIVFVAIAFVSARFTFNDNYQQKLISTEKDSRLV